MYSVTRSIELVTGCRARREESCSSSPFSTSGSAYHPGGWRLREAWRDSWHGLRFQLMLWEKGLRPWVLKFSAGSHRSTEVVGLFHRVPMMHVTCQQSTVHMPRNCTMNRPSTGSPHAAEHYWKPARWLVDSMQQV